MNEISVDRIVEKLNRAKELGSLILDADALSEESERRIRFADLLSALADAQMEAANIKLELVEREQHIRSLEEQLTLRENLRWEEPFYWLGEGDSRDGPFCQKCYEGSGKLSRPVANSYEQFHCVVCETTVVPIEVQRREDELIRRHNSSQGRFDGY